MDDDDDDDLAKFLKRLEDLFSKKVSLGLLYLSVVVCDSVVSQDVYRVLRDVAVYPHTWSRQPADAQTRSYVLKHHR